MTSEQSPEEKDINAVSENEESKGDISSLVEESNQQNESSGSQSSERSDNDDDSSSLMEEILPPEVVERLSQNDQRRIESSLSIMSMSGSPLQSSSIAKQVKPEHVTQIIANSEKDSQREFEKSKISENTKRLGIGAILSLVIIVLVYAGLTKDKDLSERIFVASISAIGRFGAGYAVGKDK
jgi:hypothetical protein